LLTNGGSNVDVLAPRIFAVAIVVVVVVVIVVAPLAPILCATLLPPRPPPFLSHVEEFTTRTALAFCIARARMRNARTAHAATVSVRESTIANREGTNPPTCLPSPSPGAPADPPSPGVVADPRLG
jgi:hypothetical protein